ncbi:MAG: HAMP domain-containing histidine kinase, partial [Actinomycetota bacterium]|nr:HAMP domain-containing histidine kinase [Actinomycetota bacterium]
EVLDARRRIVARSSALGGRLLGADAEVGAAIARGRTAYARIELSGDPLRLFVAPLPDTGGQARGGAVLVAATIGEIERTTDRVRTLILLSAFLAALLGALLAAALTGRGLAPLRRLTVAAGGIERTGDPADRLPPAEGGEVGELTRTLNAMLAALQRAREGERRFLADASHELRTPLTALRGNVDHIARHGADAETVADVQRSVERVARLVDDLLALERTDHGGAALAPVALDDLARAVADRNGAATVDAPEGVVVRGDEDALRRALDNLVANAFVHGLPPVTIAVRADGGRARLSVRDGGPGLTADQSGAAFERFWRAPRARGRPGSGLGLAIVRAIARAHGGEVEVSGATFTIDLPVVRESSDPSPTVVA